MTDGLAAAGQAGTSADLQRRVVIITGAGQGIGRVFAKSFAAAGAIPVIAELSEARAAAVAQEIKDAGQEALAVAADISDPESVDRMARTVIEQTGRIDVLLNNAAIFSTLALRPFDQIPLEEWDAVMRVNVTGVYLCCRAVVPTMRTAGWGRIINISSSTVTIGRPNFLHYVTSKAAVIGLTRALAREVGVAGITVNAILPSATATEVGRLTTEQKATIAETQCIPRPQTPQDLVGMAMFLASDASAFVTGQSIAVDGGATHR